MIVPGKIVAIGCGVILATAPFAGGLSAQDPSRPAFDVASVKLNKSSAPGDSNFPLGPGDTYRANGGRFWAVGFPLAMYINFTYKLTPAQIQQMAAQLPAWAAADRYDIEGRVQGDPGKDGMRALMRALLAERFKLAVHEETKDMPVAALVLIRPGKFGPMVQPHPAGTPCPNNIAPGGLTADGRFPVLCGRLLPLTPGVPGRIRFGARDITPDFFARSMSDVTASGRPMIDDTGLSGTFDVNIEFSRGQLTDDPTYLSFEEALKEQLGMLSAKEIEIEFSIPVAGGAQYCKHQQPAAREGHGATKGS